MAEAKKKKASSKKVVVKPVTQLAANTTKLKALEDIMSSNYTKLKSSFKILNAAVGLSNEATKTLIEGLENLRKEVAEIKAHGGRNRGPKSTRVMTEEDAIRVISGDMARVAVRKAAEQLGLSYGQVYSAKGGYTFKHLQPIKGPTRG